MSWARIRKLLLPDEAERDEGFRQDLLQLSYTGLKSLGAVAIGGALFLALGRWLLFPTRISTAFYLGVDLVVILIGVTMLGLAQLSAVYPYSRLITMIAAELTCAVLIGASLYTETTDSTAETFIPGQMTLAVLVVIVALPLRPVQAFFHSVMATLIYVLAVVAADRTFLPGATVQPEYILFMAMLTVLATALAAVLYAQRRSAYFAYLQTLQAVGELRKVQQRLALSESASSMARLSAAISHELNTPVGALKSGVDTLLLLSSRQATAPPEQIPRLLKLQADLRASIQESANRLQQIAARVARFTNLDQADLQQVSVNLLISDVAELIRPKLKPENELKLELAPVPDVVANPQRLSSVFFDLVTNSVNALNGSGRVDVRTRRKPAGVEVEIADSGRGIERERLASIFEPGFQESAGRMATGNWSMFNARQIVREQGGDITIASLPGKGTTVTVTLPLGRLS